MQHSFDKLTDAIATHRAMYAFILSEYIDKKQRNSEYFKPSVAKDQNASLAAYTFARIENQDVILAGAFRAALAKMRAELARCEMDPADRDLISNLRMMQSFGVKMTPADLTAYVQRADGNLTVLYCLAEMAKDSGCRLAFMSAGDHQTDIELMEHMSRTPLLIAPDGYIQAAMEVFPAGTTEAYIRARTEELDAFAADTLPRILDRWTNKSTPSVTTI